MATRSRQWAYRKARERAGDEQYWDVREEPSPRSGTPREVRCRLRGVDGWGVVAATGQDEGREAAGLRARPSETSNRYALVSCLVSEGVTQPDRRACAPLVLPGWRHDNGNA